MEKGEDLVNAYRDRRIVELSEEVAKLRLALREIALADHCLECSWGPVSGGVRNTCCLETEPDPERWCVTCVAAHALGWDCDQLVRECAGKEYVEEAK